MIPLFSMDLDELESTWRVCFHIIPYLTWIDFFSSFK